MGSMAIVVAYKKAAVVPLFQVVGRLKWACSLPSEKSTFRDASTNWAWSFKIEVLELTDIFVHLRLNTTPSYLVKFVPNINQHFPVDILHQNIARVKFVIVSRVFGLSGINNSW